MIIGGKVVVCLVWLFWIMIIDNSVYGSPPNERIDDNINNPELIKILIQRNRQKGDNLDLIDKQLLDLSQKRDLFNQLYHMNELANIELDM